MKMCGRFPLKPKLPSFAFLSCPDRNVEADTVLVEMTNPQLEQEALDAQLQVKAAEAEYQSLRVRLDSDLMTQRAGAATVNADYSEAQRKAQTDKALYDLGVVSGLTAKASQGKADELVTRNQIEDERLKINQKAIVTQLAVAAVEDRPDARPGATQAGAVGKAEGARRSCGRSGRSAPASWPARAAGSRAGESRPAEPPDGEP